MKQRQARTISDMQLTAIAVYSMRDELELSEPVRNWCKFHIRMYLEHRLQQIVAAVKDQELKAIEAISEKE